MSREQGPVDERGPSGGPVPDGELSAGVGKTALGVALIRAQESRRDDRLFDDPYAGAFLAAVPQAFDGMERAAGKGELAGWGAVIASHAVVRTRFYDDYLLDAVAAGAEQVVLLAAGLDTRAYRLAWPDDVRLYEIDQPGVLEFKDRVLAGRQAVPRCPRVPLAADLLTDWASALVSAGFQPRRRTAWLAEGLLIYLSAEEVAALFGAVGGLSAPGSRLALEYEAVDHDEFRAKARQAPAMAAYSALWKGGLPDTPGWLADHGWLVETHDRARVTAGYGRPVPGRSAGGFVTASRAGS